ncbi:hypothetical protein [Micromonospora sp. ATA51]|uniref:hypothetical protein n=1 Tax=Micromonospora sp. ATA51 TaxID=2806098 RepID=UPI001EE3DF7F|nr:hypothetical protein [Micromonospora sp. ATA51]
MVAARAAGLPPPAMSVYANVADLDGLAASCAAGRRLGFLGRAAIHPRQLPVIAEAFRPAEREVAGPGNSSPRSPTRRPATRARWCCPTAGSPTGRWWPPPAASSTWPPATRPDPPPPSPSRSTVR